MNMNPHRLTALKWMIIVGLTILSTKVIAGTLTYDGFDYVSGSGLSGNGGGFGWHSNWTGNGGPTLSEITAPGLFLPTAIGNAYTATTYTGYSLQTTRILETNRFSVLDGLGNIGASGTDLWFSFLVRDRAITTGPEVWGGLRLFPGSIADQNSLFIGKLAGEQHRWGIGYNVDPTGHAQVNPALSQIIPTAIEQDQTYLMVAHFVSTTLNEQISLYVNPSTTDVSPPTPDAVLTLPAGAFTFDRADFEVGESLGRFTFDELTFGTEYKSVALNSTPGQRIDGVPELSTGMMLMGALGMMASFRRFRCR